jgi:hypothetical protein
MSRGRGLLCFVLRSFAYCRRPNAQTGGLSPAPTSMTIGRSYQTATLLPSGNALFVGGKTANVVGESFTLPAGTFQQVGSLITSRTHHTATCGLPLKQAPNGCIPITGGIGPNGTTFNTAELYGPANNASQIHIGSDALSVFRPSGDIVAFQEWATTQIRCECQRLRALAR